MKQFLSALRRTLRGQLIPVLAVLAAIGLPVAIMAWGPNRDTFTVANPANRVVFNSITDNPHIGDERNFVNVRDASINTNGGWQDNLNVQRGKEYLVRVYVHNNANANLNLKALNARVKAAVPTTVGKKVSISGFVSADNADPKEVWDDIHFNGAEDFSLVYVPGSARIINNATGSAGKSLSDNIVTSAGAPIGYNQEGVIPGCFEFESYVYFKVKPQFAPTTEFDVQKTVRKHGDKDFVEKVDVKPGDKVDYQIYFKNNGEQHLANVVVRDVLPTGVTYVPGSTWLHNSGGTRQVADGITTSGLNIGGYAQNGNAYLKFTAQVAGNDQLPKCGPNTLRNVAKVETDYGQKEDDANVTVPKECQPEAKVACKGLNVIEKSRTQFTFQGEKIVENAEFVKYVYTVRNEAGQVVKTIESNNDQPVPYENSTAGKYTVKVEVVARINGQEQRFSDGKCEEPFEVTREEPKLEYACDYLKLIEKKSRDTFVFEVRAIAKNVVIKEYKIDFGDNQSETFGIGKEVRTHTYAKPGEYTAKAWVTFELPNQKTETKTSTSCEVKLTVEEPPVVPPTPEKPETPEELPSTGPEALLAGIVGSSALGYGVHAFASSRRKLAAVKANRA